ncbi:MAG: DUF411 domain-containing protein [Nevskiaceae bacterium]|nr:MAG: DUF411 domain-containing protein [Nevskiaceae bacterium]TBR72987.1 MAG: DUF411 domain-containing protein [Nevskiaceae bacterium]
MNFRILLTAVVVLLAACGSSPPGNQPTVEVWKSPTCNCCSKWIEYLRKEGFKVVAHNETAMNPLKAKLGVPPSLASCHTGVVNGYVIEGHVPAQDIRKLLADKPAARGLAVPGMPIGSPGMEQGERRDAYETVLIGSDGSATMFAEHGDRKPAASAQP